MYQQQKCQNLLVTTPDHLRIGRHLYKIERPNSEAPAPMTSTTQATKEVPKVINIFCFNTMRPLFFIPFTILLICSPSIATQWVPCTLDRKNQTFTARDPYTGQSRDIKVWRFSPIYRNGRGVYTDNTYRFQYGECSTGRLDLR